MTKFDGYQIMHTAGDTLRANIGIRAKVEASYHDYELSEGDSLQFELKDAPSDSVPFLVKSIPIDTLILELSSSETGSLQPRKEPYPYKVKLTTAEGIVDTFIKGALYIVE